MTKPTTEQIRIALAEAINLKDPDYYPTPICDKCSGTGLVTIEQWDHGPSHEEGCECLRPFDPFTNPADLEALEAWAWDEKGIGIGLSLDLAEIKASNYLGDCDYRTTISHDGIAADMLRAKREAVCRAIYAALVGG